MFLFSVPTWCRHGAHPTRGTRVPTIRISKRATDEIVAGPKTAIYYDTDLKGFGLRVTSSNARAWIVEYRPGNGGRGVASRRMTIGSAGTLTVDEARRKARDVLASARLGGDPALELTRRRETPTV